MLFFFSHLLATPPLPVLTQQAERYVTELKIDPTALDLQGERKVGAMYVPTTASLSDEKPASIKKEPSYAGKVKYGVISLGNGPRRDHPFALESLADGQTNFYFDLQANGDLTQPAKPSSASKTVKDGITSYAFTYLFRVSYGTPVKEDKAGTYGLNIHFSPERGFLAYHRSTQGVGQISIGGEKFSVRLIENGNDAVYSKSFLDKDPGKPVWLVLDGQSFDTRGTFGFSGKNFQATLSPDGSKLTLQTTSRFITAPKQAISAASQPEGIPKGANAPDFSYVTLSGEQARLSDLKGKVVVLDFWATWCGPCQASLPHVQKIWDKVKGKATILALNVWDDQKAYQNWLPSHKEYTFPFGLDPAGREKTSSVASSLYKVRGIPTTYVIDGTGKVVEAIVGYSGIDDHRLEEALAKAGVEVK